jgi:hypothetical protein
LYFLLDSHCHSLQLSTLSFRNSSERTDDGYKRRTGAFTTTNTRRLTAVRNDKMNGSEAAGEGAQKPPPLASAANGEGGENGEAALAKKRKKEGLKPIITTDEPQTGYVRI